MTIFLAKFSVKNSNVSSSVLSVNLVQISADPVQISADPVQNFADPVQKSANPVQKLSECSPISPELFKTAETNFIQQNQIRHQQEELPHQQEEPEQQREQEQEYQSHQHEEQANHYQQHHQQYQQDHQQYQQDQYQQDHQYQEQQYQQDHQPQEMYYTNSIMNIDVRKWISSAMNRHLVSLNELKAGTVEQTSQIYCNDEVNEMFKAKMIEVENFIKKSTIDFENEVNKIMHHAITKAYADIDDHVKSSTNICSSFCLNISEYNSAFSEYKRLSDIKINNDRDLAKAEENMQSLKRKASLML